MPQDTNYSITVCQTKLQSFLLQVISLHLNFIKRYTSLSSLKQIYKAKHISMKTQEYHSLSKTQEQLVSRPSQNNNLCHQENKKRSRKN